MAQGHGAEGNKLQEVKGMVERCNYCRMEGGNRDLATQEVIKYLRALMFEGDQT